MSSRVLYISQTGMTEPLGRSQVVPYLAGLSERGWAFDLIALEPASTSDAEIDATRSELSRVGIHYHPARRSASHDRWVKADEMGRALLRALSLARRSSPKIVHARSDLPTMVATALSAIVPRAKSIYDCRGLLADEYADAGHWSRDSLNYRVLRRVERVLFARADAVVSLTERARDHLVHEMKWVSPDKPFAVVPCCVDVERFVAGARERLASRERLSAGERFVLVYSGTLGSWYCEEEMAQLVAALRRRRPTLFVAYTRSDPTRLRHALDAAGVPSADVRIESRTPAEMPAAIAAADGAVSFIKPCYSKLASSPTKVAEYLAVGLPVAMNRGIGDAGSQIDRCDVFADAADLRAEAIERAADRLLVLADRAGIVERCRATATALFDLQQVGVQRYATLYEQLAGRA